MNYLRLFWRNGYHHFFDQVYTSWITTICNWSISAFFCCGCSNVFIFHVILWLICELIFGQRNWTQDLIRAKHTILLNHGPSSLLCFCIGLPRLRFISIPDWYNFLIRFYYKFRVTLCLNVSVYKDFFNLKMFVLIETKNSKWSHIYISVVRTQINILGENTSVLPIKAI